MIQVKSISQLNDILSDKKVHEFRTILNGGMFSRKDMNKKRGYYHITNHIDDSKQKLTEEQLTDLEYTNIGMSIKKGALVCVDDEI